MRLDKFLWCVRIYKTREQSAQACRASKVLIEGKNPKASAVVLPGNVYRVDKGLIRVEFKVLDIPKQRVSAKQKVEFIDILFEENLLANAPKIYTVKTSDLTEKERKDGKWSKTRRRETQALKYFHEDSD